MAPIKGSYILVLELEASVRLEIGRLGPYEFPAGLYLYCGSALNGLEARIRRHLRRDKKLHWHIDYLVAAAPVAQVWWQAGAERRECEWAEAIAGLGGEVVVRSFGSSDCRCPAHLMRWERGVEPELVRRMLEESASPGNSLEVYSMLIERNRKTGATPLRFV